MHFSRRRSHRRRSRIYAASYREFSKAIILTTRYRRWCGRRDNSNVEEGLLSAWLLRCGYTQAQIGVALYKLRTEADNHNRTLYGNNQAVYKLLRYGVPVKIEAGKVTETVHLIDWNNLEKNDFAIAEEVTLKGSHANEHERRPDLVLYVNGIAIGVIELKNSRVTIGDGIRQLLSNQLPEFNEWFFSTVQITFASNDSEGLQYGAIGTPEKYFLKWKEDEADNSRYKLDKYLLKMCNKRRLIELMYDFVLFDGGVKKTAARASVFWYQGGAAACAREAGWHQPRAASASASAAGDDALDLALKIDYIVKAVRPDGWRGVQAREQVIKGALYGILQNIDEVEHIFLIIKAQREY